MVNNLDNPITTLCRRLGIDNPRFVEIEAKRRIIPEQVKDLRKYLLKRKKVKLEKTVMFFDQFLDTPKMELAHKGASLRLRYRQNASRVYLQYKGPGFSEDGLLFRSEFSSPRLTHLLMEESHHDIIHFTRTSVKDLMSHHMPSPMAQAMRRHLGAAMVSRISIGPIISLYQKDKFMVKLGGAFLEPSIDRVFAFHINRSGLHPLSTFCEYENEIKTPDGSLAAKLRRIRDLLKFDAKLCEEFDLRYEPLDKYHRCISIFLSQR
jgi:inorganic triphosphatase YgiF